MKLLFVFTGGTIGSTLKPGRAVFVREGSASEKQDKKSDPHNSDKNSDLMIRLDRRKPYTLIEAYKERCGIDYDYDTAEPLTVLSENATGETIAAIIKAVQDGMASGKYDGIIVTHGTDTLQYTAAALGYALGNTCLPVCLVSANRPVEDPQSNGLSNLNAAVEWIRGSFGRGVAVCYHNPGDRGITVHRSSRLIAAQAYSDRFFSVGDMPVGWMSGQRAGGTEGKTRLHGAEQLPLGWKADRPEAGKINGRYTMPSFAENVRYTEREDELLRLPADKLRETCESVIRLVPFPGMTYPAIPEGVTDILHESFHSGTIRTNGSVTDAFFAGMRERGIRVWLTGASAGAVYESTERYREYGIRILPEMSPIAAYMKLWMLNADGRDTAAEMDKSLGGDIIG